eukprot:381619-Rhodomonas_salina.3
MVTTHPFMTAHHPFIVTQRPFLEVVTLSCAADERNGPAIPNGNLQGGVGGYWAGLPAKVVEGSICGALFMAGRVATPYRPTFFLRHARNWGTATCTEALAALRNRSGTECVILRE